MPTQEATCIALKHDSPVKRDSQSGAGPRTKNVNEGDGSSSHTIMIG